MYSCIASIDAATTANVVVAIATLGLAGVTAWMAYETRKVVGATTKEVSATLAAVEAANQQARASARQAELAEESLTRSVQPILSNVIRGERPEPGHQMVINTARNGGSSLTIPHSGVSVLLLDTPGEAVVSIPVRNIGVGPAVIRSARLVIESESTNAEYDQPVLAAGETTRFAGWIRLDPSLLITTVVLDLLYTDVRSGKASRTELTYRRSDDFANQLYIKHVNIVI